MNDDDSIAMDTTTTTTTHAPQHLMKQKRIVSNYFLETKLGSGSFATVFRGVLDQTAQNNTRTRPNIVAIKAISTSKTNSRITKKVLCNLESEIRILREVKCRTIVGLLDVTKTERHIYLVLEYCAGGDLQRLIRSRKRGRLSEGLCRRLMRDLTHGLKFLWNKQLIHRDIKPQNLLLTGPLPLEEANDPSKSDEEERARSRLLSSSSNANNNLPEFHLKIADFGFARHLNSTALADTLCGSPLYMAPEILQHQRYDAKADLWSTGTVLFEMLTGKPPFHGENHLDLLRNIQRKAVRLPSDVKISPECVQLLRLLLHRNPMRRASFEQYFEASDNFVTLGCNGKAVDDNHGEHKHEQALSEGDEHEHEHEHINHNANTNSAVPFKMTGSASATATSTSLVQRCSSNHNNQGGGGVLHSIQEQEVAVAVAVDEANTNTNTNITTDQNAHHRMVLRTTSTSTSTSTISSNVSLSSSLAANVGNNNSNSNSNDTAVQLQLQQQQVAHVTPPLTPRPTPNLNLYHNAHPTTTMQRTVNVNTNVNVNTTTTGLFAPLAPSPPFYATAAGVCVRNHVNGHGHVNGHYPTQTQFPPPFNLGSPASTLATTTTATTAAAIGVVVTPDHHAHAHANRSRISCQNMNSSGGGGGSDDSTRTRISSSGDEFVMVQTPPPLHLYHAHNTAATATAAQPLSSRLAASANHYHDNDNDCNVRSQSVKIALMAAEDVGRRAVNVAHVGDTRAYLAMQRALLNKDMHCNPITTTTDNTSICMDEDMHMHMPFADLDDDNLEDDVNAQCCVTDPNSALEDRTSTACTAGDNNNVDFDVDVDVDVDPNDSHHCHVHSKKVSVCVYFREALACYLKALSLMKGAVGAAKRVMDALNSESHLMERCQVSLRWLSGQFNGILERADAAKAEIAKFKDSEGVAESLSAEELMYNHALSCGKDGAVKQLLGQCEAARACYKSAGLLLEALLMESDLPGQDLKLLEGYVQGFAERIKEVQRMQMNNMNRVSSTFSSTNASRMNI